jgi:hypothetical protein
MKFFMFLRGLWNYYVIGTWYAIFTPKHEEIPGNDESTP